MLGNLKQHILWNKGKSSKANDILKRMGVLL